MALQQFQHGLYLNTWHRGKLRVALGAAYTATTAEHDQQLVTG
jgi:hypothetical protein